MTEHTIAAIATPTGRGGISVIRISGQDAIGVSARVFRPADGSDLSDLPGNRTVYGRILSSGEVIDDGIAAVFRAPHSYTGEDVVEISCHGGVRISGMVLKAVFEAGAEQAGPGEFTRRAFTAGKLSLTQAEAVMDLIDAESDEQLKLAQSHREGTLSREIGDIYEDLRSLVSQAYVYADYPDEDLTDVSVPEMIGRLKETAGRLERLADTYRTGRAVWEGIPVAIIGRPNSGKSSLLNALLGRERAIVTDIAGTTRDTIEETLYVGGVKLLLTDTAGLRKTDDPVESVGVGRAERKAREAEVVLGLLDSSEPFCEEDREFLRFLDTCPGTKILLLNKSDLPDRLGTEPCGRYETIRISCATGAGLDALRKTVSDLFMTGRIDYRQTAVLSNARQAASVTRAAACVRNACGALVKGFTQDIAGLDIEAAMAELGQTDGRSVSADIVDSIFHRFCVGK